MEGAPTEEDKQWALLPDFDASHRIIRAKNWPEYAALGFEWAGNVDPHLLWIGGLMLEPEHFGGYGHYGLYLGDGWDVKAEQPSEEIPGIGVYSNPEGRADRERSQRHVAELVRRKHADPGYDLWGDVMATHRNIRESNWPEYAAAGFVPITDIPEDYPLTSLIGWRNLYTGDAWDAAAGHPVGQDPPRDDGCYTSPAGLAYRAEVEWRHWQYRRRLRAAEKIERPRGA